MGAVCLKGSPVAMVIGNIDGITGIFNMFEELTGFSNLHLNLKQTVAIPLFYADLQKEKDSRSIKDSRLCRIRWRYSEA